MKSNIGNGLVCSVIGKGKLYTGGCGVAKRGKLKRQRAKGKRERWQRDEVTKERRGGAEKCKRAKCLELQISAKPVFCFLNYTGQVYFLFAGYQVAGFFPYYFSGGNAFG